MSTTSTGWSAWTSAGKRRQHAGDERGQILRDQSRPAEAIGGFSMNPYGRSGGFEAWHFLREEAAGDAGKHIARAGRAEPRRGVGIDCRAAVRRGDDRVAAL